jgi:DNA repair exonuclease SbcCD nuclease subunit
MSTWLLTADLQFDSFENYSTQTTGGITSRLKDMMETWYWMLDEAKSHKCKGIIAVGDIFDSRTVLELPVLDQVCRAVQAASDVMEVHFVAGNHDSYLRSPAINSLQVFSGKAHIWDKPGSRGTLGFLPWSEDMDWFAKQPKLLSTQGVEHLFSHVMVRGAVHSAAGGIPVETLRPDLFKSVWLGDVHEPTQLAPNVAYIGSPMQLDYGDAGGRRGVWIFNDKVPGVKQKWLENKISPRFHILSSPSVEGVRPIDFVRIRTDDAEIAALTMKHALTKTSHVETTYVESTDTKPRVDVRSSMEHEELLKKYCAFKGLDDNPELIATGLELLERAK